VGGYERFCDFVTEPVMDRRCNGPVGRWDVLVVVFFVSEGGHVFMTLVAKL